MPDATTEPTLESRLTADMKAAMKGGDRPRLGVIRMVLSEVKNADLNNTTPEKAVEAYVKSAKKALETYRQHDDAARAAESEFEISVAEAYLPQKKSEAETAALVDQFLAENDFAAKDAGRATGQFMKQHGSNVDAGVANKLIRAKLS